MAERTNIALVLEQLGHATRIEEIASVVREVGRRLIGCDGVTFVVREGERCHYVEEDAISPLWKGQRFPSKACVSGWVMQHGGTVIIPDVYADPRVLHAAYRATFVKSMAMVAVGPANAMAAIGAYWATHHEATESEVEILRAMADSAALALGV